MEGVILFADDHIYTPDTPENALFKALRTQLPTIGVHDLEFAKAAIKSIGSFRALILDWQYGNIENFDDIAEEIGSAQVSISTSQSEDAAYQFLLKNDIYSLIYIFSEQDIEETHGTKLREKFGKRVKIRQKDGNFKIANISSYRDSILRDIQEWKENNQNLSIPILWSSVVNRSLQEIFQELSEADKNWIKDLYDSAYSDGAAAELLVIEILQLLLYESVVQSQDLIDSIVSIGGKEIAASEIADKNKYQKSISRLFSRLFYSDLKPNTPIMTGDVCKISENEYGIIISPECDIRHIKEDINAEFDLLVFQSDIAKFAELIKGRSSYDIRSNQYQTFEEKKKERVRKIFNQEDAGIHLLPSIKKIHEDCNTTCVINFRYAGRKIKSSNVLQLPRPFKINSPFIQQLRQRYIAYIGRIGTPALPTSVRDWNLA